MRHFREWRMPRIPQEARTFRSRLGNRSVLILDPRLTMVNFSNNVQGQLLGSVHILMFLMFGQAITTVIMEIK